MQTRNARKEPPKRPYEGKRLAEREPWFDPWYQRKKPRMLACLEEHKPRAAQRYSVEESDEEGSEASGWCTEDELAGYYEPEEDEEAVRPRIRAMVPTGIADDVVVPLEEGGEECSAFLALVNRFNK